MPARIPTLVSWSGGKDSAMALLELQRSAEHEVVGLLTTVDAESHRIAFHNVHRNLIRAQARSLNLPLHEVLLPTAASNLQYEAAIRTALAGLIRTNGLTVAYGDLFLQDIRNFREQLAGRIGITPIFPLWRRDTRRFVDDFVAAGFHAIVVSVDLSRIDASIVGRRLDADLLAELPAGVDACGENGEFHSFVVDGPNFLNPVPVTIDDRTVRDGYRYCGLTLASDPIASSARTLASSSSR